MPGDNDPGLAMSQSMMMEDLKQQLTKLAEPTGPGLGTSEQLGPNGALAMRDFHSFLQAEIENWFTHHAPSHEQLHHYSAIRSAAKMLAETINRHVPAGPDKSAAMRKLREAVMTANAGIACHVEQKRPTIEELEKILAGEEKTPVQIKPDGSIAVGECDV